MDTNTKIKKNKNNKKHKNISRGPEGRIGPTGPPGPPCSCSSLNNIFIPTIINKQNKIIDPLDINDKNETIVISIEAEIPEKWKTYDLILSGSLFADGTDVDCGIVISFYYDDLIDNKKLIGSQIIGHNNTNIRDGIGFNGYHKEILSNIINNNGKNKKFCMSVRAINTYFDNLCDITVINRYMYIQAIRQS